MYCSPRSWAASSRRTDLNAFTCLDPGHGRRRPDSDYDLLLVVPDSADTTRRQSRLAYEVLWETGRAADVIVLTRGDFESRVHLAASLPATVAREGRLLYAA